MLPDPRACFLRACALDVAVFKPGNVSLASAGHGMSGAQFLSSSRAAAEPLFRPGTAVGARIEAAVAASWAATGCNTNLGIVLLCAPIAVAAEREAVAHTSASLRTAITRVLADLDVRDAADAYRGIALANPGGLGQAAEQDVHAPPTLTLRAAMALAADRDVIARQYRDGYAALFDLALPSLPSTFRLVAEASDEGLSEFRADQSTAVAVLRLYLRLLSSLPDSHIVRKHGAAVAQNVMREAQAFDDRALAGDILGQVPGLVAWDAALKARRINPGTTADMTVATLMLAGLIES